MLGIIIGVGAVIGMLAIGDGFQQYLSREFDQTYWCRDNLYFTEYSPSGSSSIIRSNHALLLLMGMRLMIQLLRLQLLKLPLSILY